LPFVSLDQQTLDSLRIERDAPRRQASGARSWLVAGAVLAAVAGGAAYWLLRAQPIEVELAIAAAAPGGGAGPQAAAVLNASGYVVARREATVSAKVTGKIATVLVEEGMTVEEGQLLAQLDDQTLQPQLALAQSQLAAARAELD
jgi:multidrug efflux pump subunit AcrA (membrane-fusion protein)